MAYRRPWQSYVSTVILLAAAGLFLFGPVQDALLRGLIFLGVLALSVALSSWGLGSIRKKVLADVAGKAPGEEKA